MKVELKPDRPVIIIVKPKDGGDAQRITADAGVSVEIETSDLVNIHTVERPSPEV